MVLQIQKNFPMEERGLFKRGLSISHTTIMRWIHEYAPDKVFFGATDDYEGPSYNFELSEIEVTLQSLQNSTKATHL
jgi:hypothetical protein